MTLIIGLIGKKHNLMGCDSASASNGFIHTNKFSKVFTKGLFTIGYATSFRMGQLLEHHLPENIDDFSSYQKAPAIAFLDAYDLMVRYFVPEIRSIFSEHGYTRIDNNVETGGCFLVICSGCLFVVQDDFSVLEPSDDFYCIGSGSKYADGTMLALKKSGDVTRVKKSLKIGGKFTPSVCGPYQIFNIQKEG